MNVLAFDTSTDACTVALEVAGALSIDHRVEPRAHARLLLPMIDGLLSNAGLTPRSLDAIVFGRGPGSFTGVRIAVAAAQGLAFAADIGVVGISSLAAIAEGCRREHGDRHVLVALDARMGEVYFGEYRCDGAGVVEGAGALGSPVMQLLGEERVAAPEDARPSMRVDGLVHAGSGIERYLSVLVPEGVSPERIREGRFVEARDCIALARARLETGALDPADQAQPVYLRNKVAFTELERGVSR